MGSPIHADMAPILDARRFVTAAKSVAEKRRNWTTYSQALAVPMPASVKVHDRVLPMPEHAVPVRIYRPADATGVLPCVIYAHGGGFMMGDLDSSDTNAWGLCEGTGAVVVSVDYRLTPEHPFPAAFDDCYGVLSWLVDHGAEVGIDPRRIAVAGDSAGGNLSAAVCLAARDRGGPAIRAQAIIYPSMCDDPTSPSYIENANSPSLTTESVVYYNDTYTSGATNAANPYAAPIRAKDFANLPPALVHVAELDPIRDDGRHFASQLALAGSWVAYREARGMLHGFLRVRLTGPQARKEFAIITDFLSAHLD
ncbi:alpha/beta hydrolase [Bradyrhizobium sp. LHD-71]|uniref:alpha/beta hydrolase n=1 Tax=Bradyrhizobium sp. LHD-71 TaxID=3072141 RepID=UPI00280CFB76|nr:alpha/beta hydrolase [Bradyrhizobium sp. LHD-71]MDQ8727996.1 alpha/beta hydrolase [Bradyrhizobium sp. LHD-71]